MDKPFIWDADDFGCDHVISDMCQSHDCRDKLDEFHYANPNFRATLFAIPAEMTYEILEWCHANSSWIELAVHGVFHSSNYECEKLTYEEFDRLLKPFEDILATYFTKGFKAPGWQISDGIYSWLVDHKWWVADQSYNNHRRPKELPAYVNNGGEFGFFDGQPSYSDFYLADGKHHHTWDCMENGVYQCSSQILEYLKGIEKFSFVSELFQ